MRLVAKRHQIPDRVRCELEVPLIGRGIPYELTYLKVVVVVIWQQVACWNVLALEANASEVDAQVGPQPLQKVGVLFIGRHKDL